MKPEKRLYIQKTAEEIELRPAVIDPITQTNLTYYYVWYSFNKKTNMYDITTISRIFGISKIMYSCGDKMEAIKVSDTINNTIRLLAGYYDE